MRAFHNRLMANATAQPAADRTTFSQKMARLAQQVRAITPSLLFGLRLWAATSLAFYIACWLELDNAYWAATTAAIVSQPSLGASLRKGRFRLFGTVIGAFYT